MDARQFDGIAKTLSAGIDRRRVLGDLAVGALAGLFGWHEVAAVECAKEGQKKKANRPCCGDLVPAASGHCVPRGTCGRLSSLCQPKLGAQCAGTYTCHCWTTLSGLTFCGANGSRCEPCASDGDCAFFGAGAVCVDATGPQCDCQNDTACVRPCDIAAEAALEGS